MNQIESMIWKVVFPTSQSSWPIWKNNQLGGDDLVVTYDIFDFDPASHLWIYWQQQPLQQASNKHAAMTMKRRKAKQICNNKYWEWQQLISKMFGYDNGGKKFFIRCHWQNQQRRRWQQWQWWCQEMS